MSKGETQTLTFWTEGEGFTNLVRDFIDEGTFFNAYEILKDGGLPNEHIRTFFLNGLKFEGDTRKDDGLSVVTCDPNTEEEFAERMKVAIRTMLSREDLEIVDIFTLRDDYQFRNEMTKKHIDSLFKVIPKDMLLSMLTPAILLANGFEIMDGISKRFDGAILSDGRIVKCGFQDHKNLYPLLRRLKLVSSSDWMHCTTSFHITENQISGKLAGALLDWDLYKDSDDEGKNITKEMINTLCKNARNLEMYGRSRSMHEVLADFFEDDAAMGGKFGKLLFLSNCYPEVNLPKISRTEIPGVKNCIRTSPKFSMPGLLTSKFDINENSIKEIEEDWEKYKHVVGKVKYVGGKTAYTNELHYFYQEFLEGLNGVAHCRDKTFTYDCSTNQGDVVQGKLGEVTLNGVLVEKLRSLLEQIHKDTQRDIQVEFVIHNDELYIVQLRFIGKANNSRGYQIDHKKVIADGTSFYMGIERDLTPDEVLVIDTDCESHELIGKKALIVRSQAEFSHALALSFSLKIPSVFGVGDDFKLPKKFTIDTKGRVGYILKST